MNSIKEKVLKNIFIKKVYFKYIRKALELVGIKEKIDAERIIYDEKDIVKNCQYEIKNSLKYIKDYMRYGQDNILVAGEIIKGKGLGVFANDLNRKLGNKHFFYLAESEIRDKIDFPVFVVPQMFRRNKYVAGMDLAVSREIYNVINSKKYLKWAVENTKGRYSDMGVGYAENFVYYSYKYINSVLDIIKPQFVILWLEFYAYHEIFFNICKEKNIKVYFFEFGVLPGTYSFEECGQMGESIPAIQFQDFLKLEVNKEELIHAKKVWDYLYENKVTRWPQYKNSEKEINDLKNKLVKTRPTILFAGQNDYESGISPYGEYAKKYHSPIFECSDQAAVYLGELAKKNNWNIIYKPHPATLSFAAQEKKYIIPKEVILIEKMDINLLIDMVDVLVTIVSQMGYMSLLRGKPSVMLGFTQLRGKKCSYEAFSINEIENVINKAIQNGMTNEQKDNFIRHIAQVLKYYVYDDGNEREMHYGKKVQECIDSLNGNFSKKKAVYNIDFLIIKKLVFAQYGKWYWKRVIKKYDIDLSKDFVIMLPSLNGEVNLNSIHCISELCKRFEKRKDILEEQGKRVRRNHESFYLLTYDYRMLNYAKKINSRVTKIIWFTRKKCEYLLAYYSLSNFSNRFVVCSLEEPYGRTCTQLIGKNGITVEELVSVGVFGLTWDEYLEYKENKEFFIDNMLKYRDIFEEGF